MLTLTKALLSDSYWGCGNQIGHTKYLATRNFNGAQLDIQSQNKTVQTIPSPLPSPPHYVKLSVLCDAEISIGCVCVQDKFPPNFPYKHLFLRSKGG